ncbi:MAG: hypothetical protein M3139_15165 [Bacteroidota bacterium]|nr:hypothetical protein [Bacteroidota bacterium]
MLSELLQKLETEHGIPPAKGSAIINTIIQHVKEKFPQVAGMIDGLLGSQTPTNSNVKGNPSNDESENSLQQLEDRAKSKLGGFFGNK